MQSGCENCKVKFSWWKDDARPARSQKLTALLWPLETTSDSAGLALFLQSVCEAELAMDRPS